LNFPVLTTNTVFDDSRGFLIKPYSKQFYSDELGIDFNAEEFLSTVSYKNVIRGMHYSFCSKIVFVSYGEVEDVIV
jgi:dTDP-4-dehydrorhamnose 3,5-epimerase-like enzyme